MDNVIFLGPVSGNRQIEALSKGQPLVLEPNGIRNLSPRPGEPAFIPDSPGSSQGTEETHALISHVPGCTAMATFCICRGIRFRARWLRCGRSPTRRWRGRWSLS